MKQTIDCTVLMALAEQINNPPENTAYKKTKFHEIHTVQPIKDLADIQAARDYFLNQPLHYKNSSTNIRNYTLFVLGINCARRVSDMLRLQVSDVRFESGEYKNYVEIREQKTNKIARFALNKDATAAIDLLLSSGDYAQDDYLFQSRKGHNCPINYHAAWNIMKQMEYALGLDKKGINVGTHTMRKTAAYNIYNRTKDIMLTARVLNHSSPSTTRRYIGIEQDEMDTAITDLGELYSSTENK